MYDLVDQPVTSLNRGGRLLIRAMRGQPADRVARTAALVVGEAQVSQLLVPMTALARTLADANIFPATPIFDPDCTRFSND